MKGIKVGDFFVEGHKVCGFVTEIDNDSFKMFNFIEKDVIKYPNDSPISKNIIEGKEAERMFLKDENFETIKILANKILSLYGTIRALVYEDLD